ncbi:MAG: DUF1868 domain-containing protein, partial [Coleofasciculus sp. S288]|nr:DUF1868 domain-containing protein [Coleofasciculus sp. S288]
SHPLCWQLLGLMIRPRAIAVCLVPKDEDAYQRTLQFRRFIYQNPTLIALGIEQQYHFTAHITLAYFGEISPELDRNRLCKRLSELNRQALLEDTLSVTASSTYELCIHRAELRKFDDMIRYYRMPDWPVLEF